MKSANPSHPSSPRVLWGRSSSVNVQKVLWALDETGLPFRHEVAGGKFGRTDTPDFAALNPNARVPVLVEGDFALWESHAILRHLAEDPAAAQSLIPPERAPRGRMSQWLDYTAGTLQPPFIALFWQRVRLPPERRKPEAEASHLTALHHALGILDGALCRTPWLAGDTFSLADITAGSLMHRITDLGLCPPDLKGVARWHQALQTRPGYRTRIAVSYDELRA